jgi:hypothetical protein
MQPTVADYVLWIAGSLLEVAVCAAALRRRLYLRLPIFTSYLALLLARGCSLWLVYLRAGYTSHVAFYYFWLTQAILLITRGAAVAEIAWLALREYRGIWALARRLLYGTALLLLFNAVRDAYGNTYRIAPLILTAERDLELTVAAALLTLFLLSAYYRIRLEQTPKMVGLGLYFYSTVQVLNNSLMKNSFPQFHWWSGIRVLSFQITLVIWWLALRKPQPASAPTPALLPQQIYDELTPLVNDRLRALDRLLLQMLKS